MKILHVYKTYYPDSVGGVEKLIDELILSCQSYGIESEVLTVTPNKKSSEIVINNYTVHRIPQSFEIASSPFSFKLIKKFKQLASKFDIIHYHYPWPFADCLNLLCNIKKPYIITYHSDIVKQKYLLKLYQPLMKHFLSNAKKIIATSPNYVASSQVLSQFKDKTAVIPIGLNKNSYPTPSTEKLSYWQNRYPYPFFLFIGGFRYYKGLPFLIEAAQDVHADILIIGSGKNESNLRKQAEDLNLKNIHFLGELADEDKIALLTLCHAVVFPSHLRSEAFGITLVEGAMFGKPLISCEIATGTTYINIHNETGLAIPPRDIKSLRAAMKLLLNEPEKARLMGQNAQNRYNYLFTAELMGQEYYKQYQALV